MPQQQWGAEEGNGSRVHLYFSFGGHSQEDVEPGPTVTFPEQAQCLVEVTAALPGNSQHLPLLAAPHLL